MIHRLQLPDPLYQALEDKAKQAQTTVDKLIVWYLDTFAAAKKGDRFLVLDNAQRAEMEKTLGDVYLGSGSDLLQRVVALAALQIGDVKIQFTAAQWSELKRRANRTGITVEEECKSIVKGMQDMFFSGVAH